MRKGTDISKETLRGISEELAGVKVDQGEWEDMLIRVHELFNGIKALEEIDLDEIQPAFSYDPGGGGNGKY